MINSIVISFLPGLLVCLLFYFLDKNNKNINKLFLLLCFILGGVASYLSYRLEWHYGGLFKKVVDSNLLEVFIYAVFGVGIFEEGLKLFFAYIFVKLNKIKNAFSCIVFAVFTSSGFMCFETFKFYALKYGAFNIISRLFTSMPSHICFSIIMGVLLSKVKGFKIKDLLYLFLSFIIPSVLHGFYNTFLYQHNENLYLITYIYLVLLIISCIFIVVKNLKNDL